MAGYQWAKNFLKRNPDISLRMQEGTFGARAIGFNRPEVNKFFEPFTKSIDENNITPNNIYIMLTRQEYPQYQKECQK